MVNVQEFLNDTFPSTEEKERLIYLSLYGGEERFDRASVICFLSGNVNNNYFSIEIEGSLDLTGFSNLENL
jgi:hypothetical protein